MYLRIPEQYRSGIEYILNINDETINVVLSAFRDFPPTVENVVYKISEKIVQTQKLDSHTTLNIVGTLVSLRQLYKQESLSSETVADLISKSIETDLKLVTNPEKIERFRQRLLNLLDALETIGSSLDISDRASDLLIEHERIFSDSRIVTDIRPVFDSETERKVEGVILVHTLRIQYRDTEGAKEFYVALDSDDLDNLHDQIIVAMDNREALESILKKVKIECINPVLESEILESLKDGNELQN
jgi:hypothetical protein